MQNFMELEKIDLKVVIFGGGGLVPKALLSQDSFFFMKSPKIL